jgi:hypothetical protein
LKKYESRSTDVVAEEKWAWDETEEFIMETMLG